MLAKGQLSSPMHISIVAHQLLTFINAYLGYNQIWMDTSHKEKTAFIITKDTFCFKVMSFGIRNANATYWTMVKQLFWQ